MSDEIKDGGQDVSDKIQAGVKAIGKKMKDTDKDTNLEYNEEMVKEKADNL